MTHLAAIPSVPARALALERPRSNPAAAGSWRRRAARLGLALGATTLALGVALFGLEIWLRLHPGADAFKGLTAVYDFHESDGHGSIRPRPGYRGVKVVEGRRIPIHLNSLGLRGPEIASKAKGETRVLFLGDSMTFGHGVLASEAFPSLVQSSLAAQVGSPITTGNAGLPGNSHGEQVRDLRRLRGSFAPDLVVSCFYTGNDFDGDFFGPKQVIAGYYFDARTARSLERSWRARLALRFRSCFVIERFLENHLPFLGIDHSAGLEPDAAGHGDARYAAFTLPRAEGLFMDALQPPPVAGEVLGRIERNFERLRKLAAPARLVAVVLPSFVQVWPGIYGAALRKNGMEPARFRRGLGAERLHRLCEGLGIACLDLTPILAGRPHQDRVYLPTDLHFSAAGHRAVAEALRPFLARALKRPVTLARSGN